MVSPKIDASTSRSSTMARLGHTSSFSSTASSSDSLASTSKMLLTSLESIETIRKELGDGPSRFALPSTERSFESQIDSLSMEEKMCYHNLKIKWEEDMTKEPFLTDYWYLRFARCSPGPEKYNEKSAWKVMCKFHRKYDKLTAEVLENQLSTKTIFPIPGLLSKVGQHEFFYVRPSRFFPKITPVQTILQNLVYVINAMVEKEKSCTEGIAMIFNMKDWNQKENYSTNYIYQFMQVLQGSVPVRIRLCLVVDPPAWFNKVWLILKTVLTKEFRQKVFIITADQLSDHLIEGYEKYLPHDVEGIGMADTYTMVADFITYRKYIEEKRQMPEFFNNSIFDIKYEEVFLTNSEESREIDDDEREALNSSILNVTVADHDSSVDKDTVATVATSSFSDDGISINNRTFDNDISDINDDDDNNHKSKTHNADMNQSTLLDIDELMDYTPMGTQLLL